MYISHARQGSQQQKHALRARSRVFYAIYGRHYCIGELGYMKMNLNLRSGKLERGSECITTTARERERERRRDVKYKSASPSGYTPEACRITCAQTNGLPNLEPDVLFAQHQLCSARPFQGPTG